MKKSIFYDDHIKSLLDVLELYHAMQYLPEKVDEKAVEFAKYLSDYMYGDFYDNFKEYEIEDIEHQEIVTYSKSNFKRSGIHIGSALCELFVHFVSSEKLI